MRAAALLLALLAACCSVSQGAAPPPPPPAQKDATLSPEAYHAAQAALAPAIGQMASPGRPAVTPLPPGKRRRVGQAALVKISCRCSR